MDRNPRLEDFATDKRIILGVDVFDLWVGTCLARRQGAGIDKISGVLLDILALLRQRRTRQSHETGSGGLEDTERTEQLEEGVDTAGLGGAVESGISKSNGQLFNARGTYTSTMQLLLLISKTLPPNW